MLWFCVSLLCLQVGDFGMSRALQTESLYYRMLQDSPLAIRWCAIEVLDDWKFTQASDVWSFGIMMYATFH